MKSEKSSVDIIVLEGKLNSAVYLNILKEIALLEGKGLIGENFTFQKGSAPVITAEMVLDHLCEQNPSLLKRHSRSPNLYFYGYA